MITFGTLLVPNHPELLIFVFGEFVVIVQRSVRQRIDNVDISAEFFVIAKRRCKIEN